jgi:hypothetical protein
MELTRERVCSCVPGSEEDDIPLDGTRIGRNSLLQ